MSEPDPPARPVPPAGGAAGAGGWAVPDPGGGGEARTTAAVLAGLVTAVAALGLPFGLVWSVVAPDVPLLMTGDGPVYAEAQPEQVVAADGWFALLAVPVGIVAAAGGWALARRVRGIAGLLAVSAGAIGAGLVAWWVGRQAGLSGFEETLAAAEPGARLARPPDLGTARVGWWPPYLLGILLVPGLAAAAAYTLLAAWSPFPDLRPAPAPAGEPGPGNETGAGSGLP